MRNEIIPTCPPVPPTSLYLHTLIVNNDNRTILTLIFNYSCFMIFIYNDIIHKYSISWYMTQNVIYNIIQDSK